MLSYCKLLKLQKEESDKEKHKRELISQGQRKKKLLTTQLRLQVNVKQHTDKEFRVRNETVSINFLMIPRNDV